MVQIVRQSSWCGHWNSPNRIIGLFTGISLVSLEQGGLLKPAPGRPGDPGAVLWVFCAGHWYPPTPAANGGFWQDVSESASLSVVVQSSVLMHPERDKKAQAIYTCLRRNKVTKPVKSTLYIKGFTSFSTCSGFCTDSCNLFWRKKHSVCLATSKNFCMHWSTPERYKSLQINIWIGCLH